MILYSVGIKWKVHKKNSTSVFVNEQLKGKFYVREYSYLNIFSQCEEIFLIRHLNKTLEF